VIGDNTNLIIENHYLGKILETCQFDTFYHEHPRTYSATSFKFIAKKLNLGIQKIEFPGRYGGNIRVTMNKKSLNMDSTYLDSIFEREKGYIECFSNMKDFIESWKVSKLSELRELKQKYSQVYAKAFPGRAAILIKLLGIDSDVIDGVFEQDASIKIGNLVPGTKIPILKDSQIKTLNPPVLVNLAWHIKNEIEEYLMSSGYSGEIRHII